MRSRTVAGLFLLYDEPFVPFCLLWTEPLPDEILRPRGSRTIFLFLIPVTT